MHTYFHRKDGCHGYDYANEMKLYSWSSRMLMSQSFRKKVFLLFLIAYLGITHVDVAIIPQCISAFFNCISGNNNVTHMSV